MYQSCGELLAIDEDYDVEEDDRDHKHPRVTPREKDSVEHPAGTMQVCSSPLIMLHTACTDDVACW